MIYEIRVYEAADGRADAMRRRFLDVVAVKFFPRHGIEVVGVFTAPVEDGRLTYMTRFADEDATAADFERSIRSEQIGNLRPLQLVDVVTVSSLQPLHCGFVLEQRNAMPDIVDRRIVRGRRIGARTGIHYRMRIVIGGQVR